MFAFASPLCGGGSALVRSGSARLLDIQAVLFDERYPAARMFGHAASSLRLPSFGFDGDLTALWTDEIYPRWLRRPTAIAGLTNHQSLICLEGFARLYDSRLIFRCEHSLSSTAQERIVHATKAISESDLVGLAGSSWPVALAQLVSRMTPGGGPLLKLGTSQSPAIDNAGGCLFSWVIAPRVAHQIKLEEFPS